MRSPTAPPGYERLRRPGVEAVARSTVANAVGEALSAGTLYDYAAHHPDARSLRGRGVAYAVPLPDGVTRVVVRRSRHGGWFASLTGEIFLAPTRAPRELEVSLRLTREGVPTPEVVAYGTYEVAPLLRRADVATREITSGLDLAKTLAQQSDPASIRNAVRLVARLLARMALAGARHPDLNVRNVLIAPDDNGQREAWLLDVDRVWFDTPRHPRVREANLSRFARSARKLREREGLPVGEGEMALLAVLSREEEEALP
ncbi:MAG: lipopolysaccharide kinase InaA family protein [Gemmatimonadaceae bacterium]